MVNDDKTNTQNEVVSIFRVPTKFQKQEFGRRLYSLLLQHSMTQSELARRAGLQRNSISTYVKGAALPSEPNLKAMARVFNMPPHELLSVHAESRMDREQPEFEMRIGAGDDGTAWVRVNKLVTTSTATKIAALLEADNANNRQGSGRPAPVPANKDPAA